MNNKITITFNDLSKATFDKGTTLYEIAKTYQNKMNNPIIGAKINNEIIELRTTVNKDTTVEFFDFNDINGYKMYQAGLKLLLITALKDLYGNNSNVTFEHSIDKGIMCNITNGKPITEVEIKELVKKMHELVEEDLPIQKYNISNKEAYAYYTKIGETEKAINVKNVSNSTVILYKLKSVYNYFYVDMPYSTGALKKFDIKFLENNQTVLIFPSPRTNNEVPEFIRHEKIINVFKEDKRWIEKLNIKYVSSFNEYVGRGNIDEFIRMNELVFDNKINKIAEDIINKPNIKIVLIAGPSSSGKTTTSKKLSMNLKAFGIDSLAISVDDYFKERVDTPRNEKGEYDFETMEAIDVELFNKHLMDLINGESVVMPKFDFVSGTKIYDGKETKLDNDSVLIIEGLHCLNEELTKNVTREVKYKIYISPFTPLSVDRHNYVSTTDLRLIRRMVRDNRTRGFDVTNTIKNWQKVRAGEELYIFPYIGEADIVMNTALVYELGILKVYAEPLLYSVDVTSPYYEEARRLVSFLKSFFPISSEYVMDNSILREFIGKSIFE